MTRFLLFIGIIIFISLSFTTTQAQSDQTINNGSVTAAVNFLASGCTYNWVNNAPDIGLPAKGIGNILPFTALNTGDRPIVATITATSSAGCTPIILKFTVNPTVPAITAISPPITISTIYGTASQSAAFIASGVNLRSGIVIRPPAGFEVSTDNVNFSDEISLNADNAQLSYIYLNPDIVRTSFNGAGDYNYNANVDNSVQKITITPITSSASATVKINNVAVVSGMVSDPILLNPGPNAISIAVTAQNGINVKNYIINITRAGSSDANLAGLVTSQGTVSPSFSPDVTNYSATVYNDEISVTPTTANSGATIKVNGTMVVSGNSSAKTTLVNGANIIPVVVTAQDGVTVKTYNLNIISTKSTNAGLAQLSLTPTSTLFKAVGTTNYYTTVSSSINTVQQTATTIDVNAKMTVNGMPVASGGLSNPITLNITGNTLITTIITAQDGVTTQTYTITISKASPTNTILATISISPAAYLTAVPGSVNLTASVSPTISTLQISATVSDENATIKINGTSVPSATLSNPIPLNATGLTNISIIVTAANGITTRTYIITVAKKGSTNAFLTNLALNIPATITAKLGTLNYTTSVSPQVTSVQQIATTSDVNATMKLNGVKIQSGVPSPPIVLNATGPSNLVTTVTSEDGTNSLTYILTISKNGSTNTTISRISLEPGATIISTPGTNNYKTSVSRDITSVKQKIVPSDGNATIKINGIAVLSGEASGPIPLNDQGPTDITTVITGQDGMATRTTVLTISKNGSTNTAISNITLTPSSALTATSSANYITSVIPSVNSVQQTVVPDDVNASIAVNDIPVIAGVLSAPISLNPIGNTIITTRVTAPDGISTKTYTVTISKNGSTDTEISQIYLTPSVNLTPVAGTNYFEGSINAAIAGIQQTVITNDPHASVTVNGVIVAVGASSSLIALNPVGKTIITIKVTAQDGATAKTYIVTITRGSNGELLNPLIANLPPTSVYVRLSSKTPAGKYNGNVTLSSKNAANAYISMVDCVVKPYPLNITTVNINKNYGSQLTEEPASTKFAIAGGTLQNGNIINTVKITYIAGGAASAGAGIYYYSIIPAEATGSSGFLRTNYNINYIPANITVLPVKLIAKADNISKDFGVENPPLTITYAGFVNNDGPAQLPTPPVIATTAVKRSTIGSYPITIGGAVSPNYIFGFIAGVLTVSAEHLLIFIPNTITPNGDGINDTWNIRNVDAYPNTTIEVFNRQGQRVFSSIGYGTAWDGTYKGTPLDNGIYYYFIKNNATVMSGNLTIIR